MNECQHVSVDGFTRLLDSLFEGLLDSAYRTGALIAHCRGDLHVETLLL